MCTKAVLYPVFIFQLQEVYLNKILLFSDGIQPLSSVVGLSWGKFCGSPSQAEPAMQWVESFEFAPAMICPSNRSSTAFVVDQNCCLVMPDEYCVDEKKMGVFSWKSDDSFLVVKSLFSNKTAYFDATRPDKVTTSAIKMHVYVIYCRK